MTYLTPIYALLLQGKKEEVVIETTPQIVKERTRCMCPVLGNAYHLADVADEIRMVRTTL